jgi:dienelactone hydrolase
VKRLFSSVLLSALTIAAAVSPVQTAEPKVATGLADKLRKLDIRVFKPGSDEAKQAPDLVWQYFKAWRDQVNRDSREWKFDTKADWEKLRDAKIANLKPYLGTLPEPPAKMAVHVTKAIAGDGFVIENTLYESRPGLWVTANLYRPEPLPRKTLPGIIIIHSHHNPKTQGELQDMGMLWARAGCYVLVPDMLGHGERRQHPFNSNADFAGKFQVDRQDYYFRYNSGLQLHLVGESLAGWMAWDVLRGVDLLLRKTGIDPERIALLGSVAAGGDVAAVTAALDPRIKVVVPFNFGGAQPETQFPLPANAEESFNYMGSGSWESTRGLRGSGAGGFLPWVLVAAAAPRGIIHAHEFAWDQGRDPVWKRYRTIMDLYGALDKLAFTFGRGSVKGTPPESTHCNNIGKEHRKMIHPVLNAWFKIDATEYSSRLPADLLQCWTQEWREQLQPRPLHELAQEWALARQKEERAQLDKASAQWPGKFQAAAQNLLRKVGGDERAATAVLTSAKGSLPIIFTTIRTDEAGAGNPRMVVCLAQAGREAFLKNRADAIAIMVQNGLTVVLVDLPGTGETRIGNDRGRNAYATSVSATAQMLGTSLLELRLFALEELLQHLQRTHQDQHLQIALWGDSFAIPNRPNANLKVPYGADPFPTEGEPLGGLLALLAPLVSNMPIAGVYVHGGLVSYRSALESPFLYLPHDTVEPCFLAKMDLDDVARRLAPRPLKLEGLINGLNLTVDQTTLATGYRQTTAAYQTKAGLLLMQVPRSTDVEIAAWFIQAIRPR